MRPRRRRIQDFNPHRRFALVTLLAAISFTLILILIFRTWDYVFLWLIAINLVTFVTFRYDKAVAPTRAVRVPEGILLMLTLLGGFGGAIIEQLLDRHKTQKASFRALFWPCAAISLALLVIYYFVVCPNCR